jgi:hypothetical protein
MQMLEKVLAHNGLVTAFLLVGIITWLSARLSRR